MSIEFGKRLAKGSVYNKKNQHIGYRRKKIIKRIYIKDDNAESDPQKKEWLLKSKKPYYFSGSISEEILKKKVVIDSLSYIPLSVIMVMIENQTWFH
jgi:hypothetical protein